MIVQGSMKHTYSGRKMKTFSQSKSSLVSTGTLSWGSSNYRRPTQVIKSHESVGCQTTITADAELKRKESKNFTVAPAYNKGAYQVISSGNVKDIGR